MHGCSVCLSCERNNEARMVNCARIIWTFLSCMLMVILGGWVLYILA